MQMIAPREKELRAEQAAAQLNRRVMQLQTDSCTDARTCIRLAELRPLRLEYAVGGVMQPCLLRKVTPNLVRPAHAWIEARPVERTMEYSSR